MAGERHAVYESALRWYEVRRLWMKLSDAKTLDCPESLVT